MLAQQIQLHKHASKNAAASTHSLMCVLVMLRTGREGDTGETVKYHQGETINMDEAKDKITFVFLGNVPERLLTMTMVALLRNRTVNRVKAAD